MKKIAIIMALFMLQTSVAVSAATTNYYNKKPAQKTTVAKKKQAKQQENYLLKYNINDLEAAPWNNNGVRRP